MEPVNWNKVLTYLLTLLFGVVATGATMMFTVVSQISSVSAKIDGYEKLIDLQQRQNDKEFISVWSAIHQLENQPTQ